jgi:hypothetical protein
VQFTPDGGHLASAGAGGVSVLDVARRKAAALYSPAHLAPVYASEYPSSPPVAVAVSGDGRWLATMSWDDTAVLCRLPLLEAPK